MALTIPKFTTGEPLRPAGRTAEPNPYDELLKSFAQNEQGYSASATFEVATTEAKAHENAIRRAARLQSKGVSVVVAEHDSKKDTSVLTFGLVPKRVINRGKVESPEVDTQ